MPVSSSLVYNQLHHHYEPHIDGLRALAVGSVVINHISSSLCPGGYVGVDIFFVLSGYLITRGILHSHQKGGFSLSDFYSKRIRRIMPAYSVVVLAVVLVALLLFVGDRLTNTLSAAQYSGFFASNFYFYGGTGYWGMDSVFNPLLHLWSLAIEEQFYMIIPLLMLICLKRGISTSFIILAGLTIASFTLSVYYYANGMAKMNFFMLPSRAWELLVGALLAYAPRNLSLNSGRQTFLGVVGLILCLFPLFTYSSRTNFPGPTALPSVMGTALLIRYGASGIVGRLFTISPCVALGRVSYSLYLWHWPVIVFWYYWSLNDAAGWWEYLSMLVLSLILAYFSWRYVEMPVRTLKSWNLRKAIGMVSTASVGLILLCSCILWIPSLRRITAAHPHKLPPVYSLETSIVVGPQHYLHKADVGRAADEHTYDSELKVLGLDDSPIYVVLGDSHAQMMAYGLHDYSLASGHNGVWVATTRNTPARQVALESAPKSIDNIEFFLQWLKGQDSIKYVFLVNRLALYVEGKTYRGGYSQPMVHNLALPQGSSNEEIMARGMRELCVAIQSMGKQAVFFAPSPVIYGHLGDYWFSNLRRCKLSPNYSNIALNVADYRNHTQRTRKILSSLKEEGLADYIDVESFFFPDGSQYSRIHCSSQNAINGIPQPIYFDTDHLSQQAAIELTQHLKIRLDEVLNSNLHLERH